MKLTELYGTKIRMTQIFDTSGATVPVTLLHIPSHVIIGSKKQNTHQHAVKILAVFDGKEKHMTKSHIGQFQNGMGLKKKIFETGGLEDKNIGDNLGIELFENALFVDITGASKGRGFQGVMKRHGMHGGPAKHGSKFHRGVGAVNQGGSPARFRKGARMPGNMGNKKVTLQNLRVVSCDKENNILMVEGGVPGSNGCVVCVRHAIKKSTIVL